MSASTRVQPNLLKTRPSWEIMTREVFENAMQVTAFRWFDEQCVSGRVASWGVQTKQHLETTVDLRRVLFRQDETVFRSGSSLWGLHNRYRKSVRADLRDVMGCRRRRRSCVRSVTLATRLPAPVFLLGLNGYV